MDKTVAATSPKVTWSPFTIWTELIRSITEAEFPGSCSATFTFSCIVAAKEPLLFFRNNPSAVARAQGNDPMGWKGYHPSGDCVLVLSLWCDQTKICLPSRSSPSHLISLPSSYTYCWMSSACWFSLDRWISLQAGPSLVCRPWRMHRLAHRSHIPLKGQKQCLCELSLQ